MAGPTCGILGSWAGACRTATCMTTKATGRQSAGGTAGPCQLQRRSGAPSTEYACPSACGSLSVGDCGRRKRGGRGDPGARRNGHRGRGGSRPDRADVAWRGRPGPKSSERVVTGRGLTRRGSFDHRRGGRDGEIVKLLEPGCVRRVRVIEQTIERDKGEVDGLELWMEFRGSGLNPSRTNGRRPRHSGRWGRSA